MTAGIARRHAARTRQRSAAHQRRQLWRQARQVPLSTSRTWCRESADLHADRGTGRAARPLGADARAARRTGPDGDRSGSPIGQSKRGIDRRRHVSRRGRRSRRRSSSKAAADVSTASAPDMTAGSVRVVGERRSAGRAADARRHAFDRGRRRPTCRLGDARRPAGHPRRCRRRSRRRRWPASSPAWPAACWSFAGRPAAGPATACGAD